MIDSAYSQDLDNLKQKSTELRADLAEYLLFIVRNPDTIKPLFKTKTIEQIVYNEVKKCQSQLDKLAKEFTKKYPD